MREVLAETITILFPLIENPYEFIQRHIWRNRKYVGENEKGVVTWGGFSTNLNKISHKYRGLYINHVQNELSAEVSQALFGAEFYNSVSKMRNYVTIYTAGFTEQHIKEICRQRFVPRKVGKKLHATIVIDPAVFAQGTTKHWASDSARLANFVSQLKYKMTLDVKTPTVVPPIEYWDDKLNLLD